MTGEVHALEALARWERNGTTVSPLLFVRLAERLGLVHLLTDAMLDAGLAQVGAWTSVLGHHALRMAINVSPVELSSRGDLVDRVCDALSRHPVQPDQLVLEITESAVASDVDLARNVVGSLSELGVRIALDDFGTGHSSLSRLQRFPIDYLKVDGTMIREIEQDSQALIVGSILELGRALEIRVIAEGVETSAQLHRLRSLDVPRLLQGFALAGPAPAAELGALVLGGCAAAWLTRSA